MSAPRIVIEPPSALVDDPVAVRLEGLRPREEVTLTAETTDEAGGSWCSRGIFRADPDGVVDLALASSLGGTWTGADAMAFLWSMRLVSDGPGRRYEQSELSPATVTLRAALAGRPEISATLERRFVAPAVARSDVRTGGLVATLFEPAERDQRTAVLVLGGSGGGLENARAGALASRGFPALALAYFGVAPLPDALVGIELEYFDRAIGWLFARGIATPGRLAVMGTSRGGELALLLASRHPEWFGGVIAYVPSGLVHGGIQGPGGDPTVRPPAWTADGEPLPGAPMAFDRIDFSQSPVHFAPGFLGGLEDRAAVEAARIPVERITAPVLLFSGSDDQLWPSPVLAALAEERLTSRSRVEHVVYDDAGHNIGHPFLPTTTHALAHPLTGVAIALGGTDAGDAFARRDSWRRALDLLEAI